MRASDAPADIGSDAHFRLAMASAGIGMAIVSRDGTWLNVNPALCRLLGYSREELTGRNIREVTHPDELARTAEWFAALLQGDVDSIDAEKRYRHRDGHTLWVHLNVGTMRGADGAPEYFICQLRDATAQHAAEAALRELNDTLERRVAERTAELEALNQQLELFAFGVSHDLRAPVRSIDSFSLLLEQRHAGQLDATGREYLQRIRTAVGGMGALIDGLLELARTNRAELKREPADFSLLADWVAAELQEAEPGRAAEISVQPGLRVVGDERMLKVLLGQLLQNAWKFSRGRERVEIEVGGRQDAAGLQLWVRDHGCGFDMAYAGRLFEPFQRLHGPEQGGGLGLGLAIARRIVERHGGQLGAESMPGVGSTFRITLPANAVPAA